MTSADDQVPTPLAALFPNGILIVGTGLIGTSAGLAPVGGMEMTVGIR